MADAPTVTYEVLALRYGIFDGRRQYQNYTMPDDHAAPDPLDFFVFAIRGGGRTIVMDTGFNLESAKRRGRELICTPDAALRNAGIDPATVKDVVLTHMHWDHAGGMAYFPAATFHIQAEEMAYCTGPCMCQPFLRRPFDVDDVQSVVRALYADRLRIHEGTVEIAPGVSLHLIGGHSGGIQSIRVPTARGWIVLAGDAAHLWGNIRRRNPFPVVVDVARMLRGFDTIEALADGPDHVIPGHDPLILKRFPPLGGNPEIVQLHLPPIG
ncbi:MAG TPA: N-acyl homoserine lactonase family protein [Acetobacteraceae bacterium]|nr:N-acyl homoserine lactonase family protein [Acetobacteraceae bacterium]